MLINSEATEALVTGDISLATPEDHTASQMRPKLEDPRTVTLLNSTATEVLITGDVSIAPPEQDQTVPKTRPKLLDGEPLSSALQWYKPPRRPYTRRELLADRTVNFLGAGLAWLGAFFLAYASCAAGDPLKKQVCFWLHGVGLIVMLNCSALYHYWAWDWRHSAELLTLDHVGISAMISGCYGPLMIQCGGYGVLAFVYCLGLAVVPMEAVRLWQLRRSGPALKWSCVDILHIIRYLVMGWACVIDGPSLWRALPTAALLGMAAGGLLYTGGVAIFVTDRIECHLAIWHAIVLLASVTFYLTNLLVLVGLPL